MYRFEKKATLVCAAASLITACCLPLSANVAFAQDSVEAQSIESKADFPSVVSDDLQPDISSVIKDGWQLDESSEVWYYGKNGKHQTGWLQSGGYLYWLDPANDGAMQTGYFNVTDAGGSTTSFYANDGNGATPFGALYQNCWLRNSDGNWFYANAGGDLAAGWFYQDGTWYYLDPATHVMQVGFVDLGSGRYYLDASGAMKTGWILVDGNWYWAYSSGALASSWQTIGGACYYFDSQTFIMLKGRQKIDGCTYIFGDYGLANGWYKDGSDWYYCSNGIAATGWKLVNSAWYYLDPASDGKMFVGYLDLGNAAYYLNPNGAMAVGWAFDGLNWYYAESSGALTSGWHSISGSWYWFDDANDHKMVTGFMSIGINQYHFTDSGALSFGWYLSDGNWYYSDPVNASGIVKTGWLTLNGCYYYLNPIAGGKMSIGQFAVDGKYYFAKASGALACREWVDVQDSAEAESCKVFAGSDCVLTGALRAGKLFISNGDGELVQAQGFVTLGGCKFYADPTDGSLCSGWKNIDGSWYFFDEFDGYARSGWIYIGGSWFYLEPSTFVMRTGWIAVGGSWYYLNSSGYMQTGWLNLGGTWYWLDSSGAMATGWRIVDGSWQYFMSNGAWVSDYMDAKAQGYSSNTNWLILVDTSRCLTSIYTGSRGNWSLNRRYVCSTGKASTPTVLGEYQVYGKGYSFGHGYTCYYYTQFYGDYLFHSSPYYVNSNRIMDPTMGVPSSAGCVRLEIQNAKWIYDNIPYGTKVVTYN